MSTPLFFNTLLWYTSTRNILCIYLSTYPKIFIVTSHHHKNQTYIYSSHYYISILNPNFLSYVRKICSYSSTACRDRPVARWINRRLGRIGALTEIRRQRDTGARTGRRRCAVGIGARRRRHSCRTVRVGHAVCVDCRASTWSHCHAVPLIWGAGALYHYS